MTGGSCGLRPAAPAVAGALQPAADPGATSVPSHGERLDLHTEAVLDEAGDDEQRVRRVGGVGEELGEGLAAGGHELLEAVGPDEVGGRLEDVGGGEADGGEGCRDVPERLARLRADAAVAREFARGFDPD